MISSSSATGLSSNLGAAHQASRQIVIGKSFQELEGDGMDLALMARALATFAGEWLDDVGGVMIASEAR